MNADIIGFIFAELEHLTPGRAAIMKLFFKGLKSHEIAAHLKITRKTVLNQKLQGIADLKKRLILKYGYI